MSEVERGETHRGYLSEAARGDTHRGYLSLGSNLGDRRANLQAAVDQLPHHGVAVIRCSSVYDTEPVGLVLDQPEFLNACVEIETTLDPNHCCAPARTPSASSAAPLGSVTGRG